MPKPDVRIYVWPVEKTEAQPDGAGGRLNRKNEISLRDDWFQIEVDHLQSLEITDGIAEQDDHFRLTLTADAWPEFIKLHNTPLYPIIGITVGTRLFGPYDLESRKFNGESRTITITGRIDREFEDTVIDQYPSVLFDVRALETGAKTQLQTLLENTEPYSRWQTLDKGFVLLVVAAVGDSKDLSAIRGALNPYGIGVSPRVTPIFQQSSIEFRRRIELYPKFPAYINRVLPSDQSTRLLEAGFSGNDISAIAGRVLPKLRRIQSREIRRDQPPSYDVPDINNEPAAFRFRRIDIATRDLYHDARVYTSGTRLPRILLDPSGQKQANARVYIEAARWRLQNSSAKASLNIWGDSHIVSGQFIQLDRSFLLHPEWRIESMRHTITPTEGHLTQMGLMLAQGAFSSDPLIKEVEDPIPDIEVPDEGFLSGI